jgi:hypothetical protein
MLRSEPRAQELVLYDSLARPYESEIAREPSGSTRERARNSHGAGFLALSTACLITQSDDGDQSMNYDGNAGLAPSLKSETLEKLAARYWDKRPLVIKSPFGRAVPRSEDLFPGVVAACDAARRGSPDVRLFLEQQKRDSEEMLTSLIRGDTATLPRRDESTLEAYSDRIANEFSPNRFCLIVADLQRHDWKLLLKMRPFLRDLVRHGMVPSGGASLNLLLGDYRRTPFGVHKDQVHVFTFVVKGTKRVLLWPFEKFAGHATAHAIREDTPATREESGGVFLSEGEFRQAVPEALVLNASEGDLIYWPASFWHVVVGSGDLAMTVSWDLKTTPNVLDSIGPIAMPSKKPRVRSLRLSGNGDHGARPLPRLVERQLLAGASASAIKAGREAASVTWLRFTTGLGCTRPPEPAPFEPIVDVDVVQGVAGSPIAWARTADDHCVLAANGQSLELCADKGTLDRVCEILVILNRRMSVPVASLTARFEERRRVSRATMRDILSALGSWHALTRA